jgi:hypothetical protein
MLIDPNALIQEFLDELPRGQALSVPIKPDHWAAPHQAKGLPFGKGAIYVFSLSTSAGACCPAGPHRVLKVGMAGPKSDARFRSQHYKPGRARSTLAGRLVDTTARWHYLGITTLNDQQTEGWIKQHTDRDNFYVDVRDCIAFLRRFEMFLIRRLDPLFEGQRR